MFEIAEIFPPVGIELSSADEARGSLRSLAASPAGYTYRAGGAVAAAHERTGSVAFGGLTSDGGRALEPRQHPTTPK